MENNESGDEFCINRFKSVQAQAFKLLIDESRQWVKRSVKPKLMTCRARIVIGFCLC